MITLLKNKATKFFKRKTKLSAMLCMMLMAIMLCVPTAAFAGEPSITWKSVSQGIDSSNRYVWDGSNTDSDISGRLLYKSSSSKWGLVNDGVVDTDYGPITSTDNGGRGLGGNYNGWYRIHEGWVTFEDDGVLCAQDSSAVPLLSTWQTIKNSGNNLWMSFDGGKVVVTDNNTVLQNDNGWWYMRDGAVDFTYTGFSSNRNGEWYITNGSVDFDAYGLYNDSNNALYGGADQYYYIVGGKVQEGSESDIVLIGNGETDENMSTGWYHVSNGKLVQEETVAKNVNGWYYCNSFGKVDFSYNGIAKNSNGWWYIKEGKVDFSYNGTVTVGSDNKVASSGTTYNVTNGKVDR